MSHIYSMGYCIYVYIYKEEQDNAICNNMDGPRVYHTEWSKSEKDKYHITYMWNLKILYKWTYEQNRNRVTDV